MSRLDGKLVPAKIEMTYYTGIDVSLSSVWSTGSDPARVPRAWWRAAENAPSKVASDYYCFQLLTGCRGVEICGHKVHE